MFQENLVLVLLGLSLFFGTLGGVGLIVEYFFAKPTQKTDNYWSFINLADNIRKGESVKL